MHTPYFMLGAFCGALISAVAFTLALIAARMLRKPTLNLPEDVRELHECYTLLLKTTKRCARDLRHATQLIERKDWAEIKDSLYARCDHYETVLGGTNDYRIDLHRQIELLHREIEELTADDGAAEAKPAARKPEA